MKKKVLLFLFTLSVFYTNAQEEDAWVFFTDKENVTASIANPISILTQRAIDRKALHNVAIDERDVPVNENYITQIKAQTGITVYAKSKWLNCVHVRGELTDIQNLESLTFVSSIEYADKSLNGESRSQGKVYQDKFLDNQQRTSFNYGQAANQVEMIAADYLHEQNFTGEGMLVAVMDSGFPNVNTMAAFQRLRDNNDLSSFSYDFVDRTAAVFNSQNHPHGTMVLSDMAAFVQDEFVGIAPDATYVLFRTEDATSETPVEESYWVEAAERADSLGVDVVNTSLGYKNYDNTNYSHTDNDINGITTFITRGATIGFEKGLLLVTSAGNAGTSGIGAPGDSPGTLTIAAVNAAGNYASFSSQGSAIQPTQKPDVAAQGQQSAIVNQNNEVTTNNGTSFSSPIMAGAITSFWQAIPDKTNAEVMQLVRESASQYANPDYLLGYGIPNFGNALNQALSLNTSQTEDFKIYPNPVSDYLQIKLPSQTEIAKVKLYDVLGKLILETSISIGRNTLNLENIAKGVYLIKLQSTKKTNTFKLVKE